MKANDLIRKVNAELTHCAGFEGDEIAKDRIAALDDYFMRTAKNQPKIPGKPAVVSGDVSATVEANLASVLEAFQNSDRLIEFDAYGAADVEQAQLESDACLHFVMAENNGTWHIAQAVKSALQLRNGWMKVWCEIEYKTETEEYDNVTPEALVQLQMQDDVECKVLEYDEKIGYLKVRCKYTIKRFRAESVAPENILYPKSYDGIDYRAIQAIPFIAERHVEPRYKLIDRGFNAEKVGKLSALASLKDMTAQARNPRSHAGVEPGLDKMSENVEWFEAYTMVDGERWKVCFSQQELLEREPVTLVPYAGGVPFIAPHRMTGISVWDKTRQTQHINTQLTRMLLENAAATSRNRLAYLEGRVDPDDIADPRSNGAIAVSKHTPRVSDAVMPFNVPDTSAGINSAIQHQRQIRTELGGCALDMQSASVQMSKQVGSQGVDRIFSAGEALTGHITKNLASTLIRSTFLLAHATLREFFDKPIPIYREGDWFEVIPAGWQQRENVQVRPGMSPGERARRQNSLDRLLQAQIQFFQLGLEDIMVSATQFHALLLDWARAADVPQPERYFLNPRSEQSQAAMAAKAEEQRKLQEQQAQLVGQALETKKLEVGVTKYKADQETQFKYHSEQEQTRRKEAEIAGKAAIELIKKDGDDETRSATPEKAA